MPGIQLYDHSGTIIKGDGNSGLRTNIVPRGQGFCINEVTGTMAAALAANSTVFAMRIDPGSSLRAFIDTIELRYTTIVAYTVPITAGRRLALFRGSGAAAAAGTAIATCAPKSTTFSASEFDAASGGDARISATATLTVTGITFETQPLAIATYSNVGAAGNYTVDEWHWGVKDAHGLILEPGQLIAVRNPAAFDAAGTWQLAVEVHWREAALLTA